MASRSHVLETPAVLFGLRIVQLVTGIVILGLAAYAVDKESYSGVDLTLFTALATIIIIAYYLTASLAVPALYNYWAILGLDIFAVVFWIISFALLASQVADIPTESDIYTYNPYCYYGDCYRKRSLHSLTKRDVYTTWRNSAAAASGLGGLEFLLFIITLVITGLYLHRHRSAGGHSMPGVAAGSSTGVTHEPKPIEPTNGQQVYQQELVQQPQQPVYAQQPIQQPVYEQQPVQQQVYEQQPIQQPVYQQQPVTQVDPQHTTHHVAQEPGTQPAQLG